MANELEQFCLIARSQKDRACANIIQQVLKDKKIHVFGELLAVPSVQALRGTEFHNALETLELFAYGTISDYTAADPARFLEMTAFMTQKLRRLTLFSLAAQQNKLPYSLLLTALQLPTLRALEDFIIDCIYGGFISAKLDQMQSMLIISHVLARDVAPSQVDMLLVKLQRWQQRCAVAKEVLQLSSLEVAQKRAEYEAENADVLKSAEAQRELLKEKIESGAIMDVDYHPNNNINSNNNPNHSRRGGHNSSQKHGSGSSNSRFALERLGLGIGGGIGGGRSSSNNNSSSMNKY